MDLDIIGWDIGGAHLKAAVINAEGFCVAIYQQPCPLWKGLDQLHTAVKSIKNGLPDGDQLHAITMTGELVDLFENRDEGVRQIITTMVELLADAEILIFAGQQGFVKSVDTVPAHYDAIASANWLASAGFAAQRLSDGLFVDIGSTTTDILLLSASQVLSEGINDYQRLVSQELIYSGIIRTAVMAVAQTGLDNGREIGLMAEYFATMADVYRLTGELNENHDQAETADGAEKTVCASAKRLARMIGCDFMPEELARWQQFAEDIRAQQLYKIQRACQLQLSRQRLAKDAPLIGAGVGRFLVKQLAFNLGRPYVDFSELLVAHAQLSTELSAADCAPAVAVAYLAREYRDDQNIVEQLYTKAL